VGEYVVWDVERGVTNTFDAWVECESQAEYAGPREWALANLLEGGRMHALPSSPEFLLPGMGFWDE
jgi:hypothetical protein